MPNCKQGTAVLFAGTPAETRVTTTRRMDPDWEAQDIAETEHSNLSPQELDALRCKAAGVPYISPQEAQREERSRPQRKTDEQASVGEQLRDLLQGIASGSAKKAAETAADVPVSRGIGFVDPDSGPPPTLREVKVASGEIHDPSGGRA